MRMHEWLRIAERSRIRARRALALARKPEWFTPFVLTFLTSKARRQSKKHPEKAGICVAQIYTAVFGTLNINRGDRETRKELRHTVDATLQQLIVDGAVVRVGNRKFSPAVVNLQPGARMLFHGCPTDSGGNVASALA